MNRIQEIDREIMRLYRERLKLLHPLKQLFWECTLRCNMSCRHCGSDCKKASDIAEMPFSDFSPVLDEIREHQPRRKTIVFTVGGEPLVRHDIVECGRRITEKGFLWGMVSNGKLIDGAMMRELSAAGLRSLAVDVDGLRDTHNWLRNDERSFDAVFNAISHIRRAPHLQWDVITCVNGRNIGQLDEMKRMLTEAGVRKWRCFTIVPMGRAKDSEDMLLTGEQYRLLMDFILKTRAEGKIALSYACEGYLGDYEGHVRDAHFLCSAGLTTASVLSDGSVSGCLSIRSNYHQGNIYTDGFWNVWENRFSEYRDREWMKSGECADCKLFRYCQGNGMHLRNDDGSLMFCNYKKLFNL
ncbi:MAG: TIGR04133 family radical SAM/SPASM protein [Bacteroidales bacterium]|nr:TIGR04133 family radical SAM/SPASM protein [Bacteroidales bacterium]